MATYDPTVYYESSGKYVSGMPYGGFSKAPGDGGPWSVLLAIDLSANGIGDWFTLDDATKGVLNNSTYKLAGDVLVDVSGWVRHLTVRRGRSRQLEKFTAGACQITLDNRERLFDPTMTASPFYGSIVPRKQIVVTKNGEPVFAGNVQDWNFDYSLSGDAVAVASSADGFAFVAQRSVPAGTATAELTGARVNTVLDEIGWPSGQRNIEAGKRTLDADVIPDNTNALAYLQKVETSEGGALFIDRSGQFTFREPPTTFIGGGGGLDPIWNGVTFGPTGVPFVNYEVTYGTEELWNSVNVTYTSGGTVAGTANAQDTASQAAYGVFETTYDTLLSAGTAAADLASTYLAKYSEPRYRINKVTVALEGISTKAQADVLALELADTVFVKWAPSNFGQEITQYALVDGIEHDASPQQHSISFTLSETTPLT